jgi:hypothetical protein
MEEAVAGMSSEEGVKEGTRYRFGSERRGFGRADICEKGGGERRGEMFGSERRGDARRSCGMRSEYEEEVWENCSSSKSGWYCRELAES